MWVALWIVYGLVHWQEAEKIQLQIFTNAHFPIREHKHFSKKADPWERDLHKAFLSNLDNVYYKYFYIMQLELYASSLLIESKEEDYHTLFNHLSVAFD